MAVLSWWGDLFKLIQVTDETSMDKWEMGWFPFRSSLIQTNHEK